MTPQEFIHDAENYIYKEVAKSTNLALGKDKTAILSVGLFLKLPIIVTISKALAPLPKLDKSLISFSKYFGAHVEMGAATVVNFTFVYYTEKDLTAIYKALSNHGIFLGFVYLHELQHILRKHNTSAYENMMTRIAGAIENPHHIINVAEDYAINYSLKDIFLTGHESARNKWPEIEALSMYNSKYHADKLSDIEILKLMISSNTSTTTEPVSDTMSSVSCNGKDSLQPTAAKSATASMAEAIDGTATSDKCTTSTDDADNALATLAETLSEIIQNNTRGTATGKLFEDLFTSIKVETGWFKRIKASFKKKVFYKTHNYMSTWANLNSTYRHIYKAPKKIFIDDKVAIILSIDHSGSMSKTDLQRLLYLIESESKRISKLTVLIHDTKIIHAFDIQNEYDISKSPLFTQALATRYTSGGTSHACVFNHIESLKIKDTSQTIYMSFSDNDSDIEQVFNNYPIMKRITNYWVSTRSNPMHVLGTNISIM